MTTGSERFEILIDATPEEVWEMLTTSDGLASWFGTHAEIELKVGGTRVVGWGEDQEIVGEVAALDRPSRLVVTYVAGDETGAEEWLITNEDTTTRLTLIHSLSIEGLDDWEGFYGDIRRGWNLFLTSMKYALERAREPIRAVDCVVVPTRDRAATYEQILKTLETVGDLVDGMAITLENAPHSLFLTDAERSLLIDQEGPGPDHVIYVQAATHGGSSAWRKEILGRLEVLLSGDQIGHNGPVIAS